MQVKQKQTASQLALKQSGDLYQCSTYRCIMTSLNRHLKAERVKGYRATGDYPYPEVDIFNKADPYWGQFQDNVDSVLRQYVLLLLV